MLLFTFTGTQVLVTVGLAMLVLIGLVFLLRYRLQRARPTANDHRTKLAGADAFRQRPIFLKIGFVLALGASFLAINWTEYRGRVSLDFGPLVFEADLEQLPPRMPAPPPPPPPPPPPVIEPIPDEAIEESLTFESNDIQAEEAVVTPVPAPVAERPAPVAKDPLPQREHLPGELFKVVEEMPTFGEDCVGISDKEARRQCSDRALLSYFGKELIYPAMARENGIKGNVVLRFVVEPDGKISSFEILRDPGAGLGAEALRVLRKMADSYRWEPGKQRGRPVRVQFNLPIRFQLE
jgi:protein TonB